LFAVSCRHQWYQIGSKVVIDVYAKNLPKDAVAVQLTGEDDKLKITIAAQPAAAGAGSSSSSQAEQQQQQAADDEDFVLEFDLFSKVVPGEDCAAAFAAANMHPPVPLQVAVQSVCSLCSLSGKDKAASTAVVTFMKHGLCPH
jgi:hypothetical protein